jgi:hypothetical protein
VERALQSILQWRPYHMSSYMPDVDGDASTTVVHVPVRRTGTVGGTAEMVRDDQCSGVSDTDAAQAGTDEWESPRISTRLSDDDLIVMLAAQRGAQGKWRFSANKIFELIGGSRATVLATVKAIQQGALPPEFPSLSVEQQATREQLQLPRH